MTMRAIIDIVSLGPLGHSFMAALLAGAVVSAAAAPNPAPKGTTPHVGTKSAPAPKKEEGFQTVSPYAILIEVESGSVLYTKNADTLVPPASLSKLMTAEVVFNEIRQGNLKQSDEIIVSENAWRRGGAPSHTSSMFAPIHSRVSVDDLLHGVIIQSANDACIALAESLAGSEEKFAEMMIARARQIGLAKSTFGNSNGLPDPRQLMTARELGLLARHIIRTYPEFYPLYGEREFTFNKIRQTNRNPLLAMNIGADGMKTGFIRDSGYGLVGSAVQNGQRLVAVVMGAKTEKERADDAKKLIEWGFHNFQAAPLFEDGQIIAEAKLFGGEQSHVPLTAAGPVKLMTQRNVREKIVARVVYSGPVPAPVEKGQKIGILKVWRGDAVVLTVPLQAASDVGVGNIAQRAFDAAGELMIGLFRSSFQKL
jgi:D-alanyl-D-alanine carboxypeptidase (penicillin-binding protein 5/6)